MIELINSYIVTRLQMIRYGNQAVTVYPYIPGRDQGKTQPPCIGVSLHAIFQAEEDARPNCETITAIGDDVTVDVPLDMGGETETGPPEYIFKPYPTPVELIYEISTIATRVGDSLKLIEGLYQSFPPGFTPAISTQKPLFKLSQVVDNDDFDLPLFAKTFLLTISDLWLDRAEVATFTSVREIDFSTVQENV